MGQTYHKCSRIGLSKAQLEGRLVKENLTPAVRLRHSSLNSVEGRSVSGGEWRDDGLSVSGEDDFHLNPHGDILSRPGLHSLITAATQRLLQPE